MAVIDMNNRGLIILITIRFYRPLPFSPGIEPYHTFLILSLWNAFAFVIKRVGAQQQSFVFIKIYIPGIKIPTWLDTNYDGPIIIIFIIRKVLTRGISQETVFLYSGWKNFTSGAHFVQLLFLLLLITIVIFVSWQESLSKLSTHPTNQTNGGKERTNQRSNKRCRSRIGKMKFTTFRENKYNLTIEQMETNICRVDKKCPQRWWWWWWRIAHNNSR